jgi:DNA-binding XRE family transcriptional regulator
MTTTILHESEAKWTPDEDFPYVMRLPGQRAVAVTIPAKWMLLDKTGAACLRPPAVLWLDKIRTLFSRLERPPTPGFIRTLRQAMSLTQEQFGQRLGVNKITVSRWERGSSKPSDQALRAIAKLRADALQTGVLVKELT